MQTSRSDSRSRFFVAFERLCKRRGVFLSDFRQGIRGEWFEEIQDRDPDAVDDAMARLGRMPGQQFPSLGDLLEAVRSHQKAPAPVACPLCEGKGLLRMYQTPAGLIPQFSAVALEDYSGRRVVAHRCPECANGARWPKMPTLSERDCVPGTFAEIRSYVAEPYLSGDEISKRLLELRDEIAAGNAGPMVGRILDSLLLADSSPTEFDRVTDEDRRQRLKARKLARDKPLTDEELGDIPF